MFRSSGIENEQPKRSIQYVIKNKSPREIQTQDVPITRPTLYFTRVWSNLDIAVDKILLLKRKVGSIGGQPFGDCVLFHLTRSEDVLRRRLS